MLDIRINNQSLAPILAGPPKITDQLNTVCRTLEINVQQANGLSNYLGQPVELWYNGTRWYYGFLRKRGYKSDGSITYTAYDPLYFLKKNKDDFYFKNVTATQAMRTLAEKSGVKVYSLANTGAVFKALYYQGAEGDKVATDLIARTYKETGTKYWYRYRPDKDGDGLHLYERKYPSKVWAFQVGVNLESAEYEESIEETCTVVKLINRETGKTVTRIDQAALKAWGHTVHFEEINKDEADGMEAKAQELLNNLAAVNTSMKADGINPNRLMPQFFSGDVIYVEEKNTRLLGAYFILNVVQTFESDDLVTLGFDIQIAPDIPVIQYTDATKQPDSTKPKDGVGVQQDYSEEMKKTIEQYGL
jgi:hypothetical protein